jgi:hypothetical protein
MDRTTRTTSFFGTAPVPDGNVYEIIGPDDLGDAADENP